jgi:PadR family transcriptional regulator, regulatory protein PadR
VVQSMKKRCRHLSPPTPKVAFYSGLTRLHILQHASEEPIVGLATAEELGRHDYHAQPRSIVSLARRTGEERLFAIIGAKEWPPRRGVLRTTRKGRRAMAPAKARGRRLCGELIAKDWFANLVWRRSKRTCRRNITWQPPARPAVMVLIPPILGALTGIAILPRGRINVIQ